MRFVTKINIDGIMGKMIYVNGSIFINTRYFVPKDQGCGYENAPEGAENI